MNSPNVLKRNATHANSIPPFLRRETTNDSNFNNIVVNTYIFKMSVVNVYIAKWTTRVRKIEGYKIWKVCQKLRLCLRGRDLRVPWWNKWKWFYEAASAYDQNLDLNCLGLCNPRTYEFCSRTYNILSNGFCARKNLFGGGGGVVIFFQLIINLWKLQIEIHWVFFFNSTQKLHYCVYNLETFNNHI